MDTFKKNCMSLAGEWYFSLDPNKAGITEEYFKKDLTDKIFLPGTTDENKKGYKNEQPETERLTRQFIYNGYAWYQKQIVISEAWENKYITLFLERTRISHVWFDDKYYGTQNSICTPHLYDLGNEIASGIHRLTILVDNTSLPIDGGHQTSADTQTNWNGILGRIELNATDSVWISDIQAYPDMQKKSVLLKFKIRNETEADVLGNLSLTAESFNCDKAHKVPWKEYPLNMKKKVTNIEIEYFVGDNALPWDEYSPSLYRLCTSLKTEYSTICSKKEITFAMRNFSVRETQFCINDRTVFLRGKHDACVFPLTGYAPMDVNGWLKVFQIAKSYGINHYRFHTCCPPEACFIAADITGIYLQIELPYWGVINGSEEKDYNADIIQYLYKEACSILSSFANHPSFVMFSLGNELGGSRRILSEFITELKKYDNRPLYTEGSNSFFWDPALPAASDFWVTMRTAPGDKMVRGSFSHADAPLGHVQSGPANTTNTYSNSISGIPIPVIGHEVGQYQSYPNFSEIRKYTGVLKPYNLELFKERVKNAGMLDKAEEFYKSSGKLAVLCYKEDIEAALRTPGFGGIQLLDLQDFPGQGTALVGILDSFMHSKGFISAEQWREFCSDIVLLACFDRYTYSTKDEFYSQIKIAHYGANDLKNVTIKWFIHNKNEILYKNEFTIQKINQGTVQTIGYIKTNFEKVNAPEKLTLKLSIKGMDIKNHYSIWVYPKEVDNTIPEGIYICQSAKEAKTLLKNGKKVLLTLRKNTSLNSIEGFFASDFWCYPMFRSICEKNGKPVAPGTLGMLCKNNHPALKEFPCDFHSDWQWWHIVMNSRPVILDKAPPELSPIVQIIDNVERNHRLGLLFEAKYAKGKLFICASDLLSLQHKPEAKQLLHSILKYMASPEFDPKVLLC